MSIALISHISSLDHRVQVLAGGQPLFFATDRVAAVFIVLEGGVDLIRPQRNGRKVILQRAREHQVLAEASVYSDLYHCDAVATRRTRCLAVDIGTFRRALADDNQFRQAWETHLAGEVQRTRQLIELLSRRTVRDRLDGWLDLHGDELPKKGTRVDLADQLGVSNEALYRELARRNRD